VKSGCPGGPGRGSGWMKWIASGGGDELQATARSIRQILLSGTALAVGKGHGFRPVGDECSELFGVVKCVYGII
jgi:hypothetical protein